MGGLFIPLLAGREIKVYILQWESSKFNLFTMSYFLIGRQNRSKYSALMLHSFRLIITSITYSSFAHSVVQHTSFHLNEMQLFFNVVLRNVELVLFMWCKTQIH